MNRIVRLALPHIEKFENAKHRAGWRVVEVSAYYEPDRVEARIVFQSPDDWGVRKEEQWELYSVDEKRIEAYLMGACLIVGGDERRRIEAPGVLLSPAPMLLIELTGEDSDEPPSPA